MQSLFGNMKKLDCRKLDLLEKILDSGERLTLVTHTHPDGDAVGSTVGLLNYLIMNRKDAMVVYSDKIGENLQFIINKAVRNRVINFCDAPEKAQERIQSSDVVILLDANSFRRTAGLEEILSNSAAKKILIDHHLNPEESQFDLIFSETETSSACEYVFYILMELKEVSGEAKRLPSETSRALMTGMTTDTNNFANSTFPSTLEMASRLLEAGVDRDAILSNLYNQYSEYRIRLMGTFLKDLMILTAQGAAYAILDKKTQNLYHMGIGDTEGFVNIPLSISQVKISIFLKEDDGHYRVSIRSKKGTSANQMATLFFNGGGHECAAGGKLVFGKDIEGPSEAPIYIENAIVRFFQKEPTQKELQ